MNPIDDQLQRLFRAAREPDAAGLVPPFGCETRLLASWRAARSGPAAFWSPTLLVRGMVVAALIMAASFLPALTSASTSSSPFSDFLQLADSTVTSDESP